MVLDIPPLSRKPTAVRLAAADALRELPPRRPEPARADTDVRWELVDVDRYEVREGSVVVGFIDVVGAVFVALSGPVYAMAVEVNQSLRFEDAVHSLRSARRR